MKVVWGPGGVGHGVRARTMLEGRAAGGAWPSICTGGIWWPGSRAASRTDLESCHPREEVHGPRARGALAALCRPRQLHGPLSPSPPSLLSPLNPAEADQLGHMRRVPAVPCPQSGEGRTPRLMLG